MIESINNEEFYALVAPDGSIQVGSLAPDEATYTRLEWVNLGTT